MMSRLFVCALVLFGVAVADAAPPNILTVTYPITEHRRSMGKAVAIGPNLVVSANHVIRDDESSLGKVIAVDRKWDRCLILHHNDSWSELRRTPVPPDETLYFEGGTCRVNGRGSMTITSGRAVPGMSGGPIWDSEGRVVALVCEGQPDQNILWGYMGLAEWVDENRPDEPQPQQVEDSSVDALKDRIAALVNAGQKSATPATARPTLRDRIAQYEQGGGQAWYVNGGQTSIEHMVRTHGWSHSELRGLSARELNLLHGGSHTGMINATEAANNTATPFNTLTLYTGSGCVHCERWNRIVRPVLESKGWHIKEVHATSGTIPRFAYRDHQWIGFVTVKGFYARLRGAIK